MFIPVHVRIMKTKEKGRGLFAKKPIKKDQKILKINGNISLRPHITSSLYSIQIDDDTYLDGGKRQPLWQYINHSCSPNAKIDLDSLSFMSIKNIDMGDEITFHYCTTEFDLAAKNEDFICKCNSLNCLKTIKGFNNLTKNQKQSLSAILIPYTLRKLKLNSDKIEVFPGNPSYHSQHLKNDLTYRKTSKQC